MLNKEKYMDELMKYACRKPMESGFAVLRQGGLRIAKKPHVENANSATVLRIA